MKLFEVSSVLFAKKHFDSTSRARDVLLKMLHDRFSFNDFYTARRIEPIFFDLENRFRSNGLTDVRTNEFGHELARIVRKQWENNQKLLAAL